MTISRKPTCGNRLFFNDRGTPGCSVVEKPHNGAKTQAAEKPRRCARSGERWKSNSTMHKVSAYRGGKKGKSSNKRDFSASERFRAQRRKAWIAESVVENVENFGTS